MKRGVGAADVRYMRRALALAARGRGAVEPNPMVGCVIVKHGRVIGEGYHRRFGGPHAEVEALARCGVSARGATVYVTLEPCCYHGKTPPCTRALIEAGVARVVAGVADPNPRVAGGGLRALRSAGIEARVGVLADEAVALNAPFFKLVRCGRPWVILKWAQSLDGRIATRTGDSKWITDETCRRHAHRERARVDAIVVGRRTVEIDDPLLTARGCRLRRVAARVVVDTSLRVPLAARLVRTASEVPTWVFCGRDASRARARRLEAAGCRVVRVRTSGGRVSLPAMLDRLGQAQMTNVLVEGGAVLLGALFDRRLADEVHVYIAPRLIGGAQAPAAPGGRGARSVREGVDLSGRLKLRRLGDGWLGQARLVPAKRERR